MKGCEIYMDYLYFPDDKTEYIPAFITLILFFLMAWFSMKVIKKISNKELRKAEMAEARMKEHSEQQKGKSSQ
jgi:peptidoglycan/LPS O-acetylase OafA/YrhL